MSLRGNIKTGLLWAGSILCHNHQSKLLYYHDVFASARYTDMGTPLSLFRQHVAVIKEEGYAIVPRIKNPEREVALLFDDGFRGIYDVRQYFYDEGICPTIFLAVSLIGKPGYLNEEEIMELQSHGFIFESHGWSHEDMTTFDRKGLHHELNDARSQLSDLLQKDVRELCLPIGYFSDEVIKMAHEAGYTTIYSSIPGNYYQQVHGSLRTRNLLQYATAKQVRYILRGGNELISGRYERMHYKQA